MKPYNFHKQHDKFTKHRRMSQIMFLCLLFLFLFSGFMFVKQLIQSHQEQAAFQDLSSLVSQQEHPSTKETDFPISSHMVLHSPPSYKAKKEENGMLSQYVTLYEKNQDCIGWLKIANTKIDFPVMFTPSDPEYYLYRAFDKTNAQSGTPFIGAGGTVNSDCVIIYGHNMKNNTMFGTLDYYKEQVFWEENKTFTFDTLYEHREYEIFAVLKTRILHTNEEGFRYYNASGELTEAEYTEFINWLIKGSIYNTNIIPAYGEQIAILSTCSSHTNNGRFIVAARRK